MIRLLAGAALIAVALLSGLLMPVQIGFYLMAAVMIGTATTMSFCPLWAMIGANTCRRSQLPAEEIPVSLVSLSRRHFTTASAVLAVNALVIPGAAAAEEDNPLSRNAVLRDPAAPVRGNPNGNLTIVEYFDYQCPHCRKVHPVLTKAVNDDGNIRLVLKDWPVFGEVSFAAARMALAAQHQGKYAEAHDALITYPRKLSEQVIQERLGVAGVDVRRCKADLASHSAEIDALLRRNGLQAEGLGFQGTPAFIVGTFRLPGYLDADGFRQIIVDARKAQAKQ